MLDCACGIGLLAAGLVRARLRRAGQRREPGDDPPHLGATASRRACAGGRTCRPRATSTPSCASATRSRTRATASPALRGMAGALKPGGRLVLTSRNWEREQPDERYEVERDGRRALVTYAWAGERGRHRRRPWTARPSPSGSRSGRSPTRRCWPTCAAAGLELEQSTWEPEAARYLVSARTGALGSRVALVTNVRRRWCSRARVRRAGRCRRRRGAGLAGPGRGAPPRKSGRPRARVVLGHPHGRRRAPRGATRSRRGWPAPGPEASSPPAAVTPCACSCSPGARPARAARC